MLITFYLSLSLLSFEWAGQDRTGWGCSSYFIIIIAVAVQRLEAQRWPVTSDNFVDLVNPLNHLPAVDRLVGQETSDLAYDGGGDGGGEIRDYKLTPALEKYSQYDRPQEENEEDEEDFLIFDINLDRGVQQVSPREGSDLWNIKLLF